MARGKQIRDFQDRLINPGERHTKQRDWANAGSITAVVAAGQAPIDVDKRADADVVALAASKKVIYEPEDGTVAFEVRVRSDGDENDELAIQMLAEAGTDRYVKIADLTCTQGTQEADNSCYFSDIITQTNNEWLTSVRIVNPEGNSIARYVLNTHGYSKFLFVCTNLGAKPATNIYIDVRRTS